MDGLTSAMLVRANSLRGSECGSNCYTSDGDGLYVWCMMAMRCCSCMSAAVSIWFWSNQSRAEQTGPVRACLHCSFFDLLYRTTVTSGTEALCHDFCVFPCHGAFLLLASQVGLGHMAAVLPEWLCNHAFPRGW